jgi:hypothetical protein
MSFDLNTLALKDTTEYQLRHPATNEFLFADADNTLPVTIELYGPSSKQYINAITAMRARDLKRKTKKLPDPTFDELKQESIDLLVACSIKVNNLTYNGAALDNPDAFRELYNNPQYFWFKRQVDEALIDPAAFLTQ